MQAGRGRGHPGPHPGAAGVPVEGLAPGGVAVGDERLAEGEVEVDGAGVAGAEGTLVGAGGERAPVGDLAGTLLGRADLGEPADRRAVQLDLVDGLAGPCGAQLGRPVGGQDQQRHAGLVGLDHRGVEVGGGGAGGAHQRDRALGPACEAEREEGRRALVDPHVQAEPRVAVDGDGQRGRARAGGQHHVGEAAAHQLVHEHAGERGGGVHLPSRARALV